MASKKNFTLKIINQEKILFYGDCSVVFLPSEVDTIAIMAYHEPMLMKLGKGRVSLRENGHDQVIADIKGGVAYVGENEVSVLVT